MENIGGRLDAYTAREITSYTGRSLADGVPKMTEIIGDMLSNPKFETAAIEAERSTILREAEEVSKDKQEAIFDQLHAVAFQGTLKFSRAAWVVGQESRLTPSLFSLLPTCRPAPRIRHPRIQPEHRDHHPRGPP